MNTFNRVALVVLAALSLSVIGAQAGTLDPRLANLAAGHMPQTRTVFKAFMPAPPDPFSPRLDSAGRVQVYILLASPSAALPDTSELTALGAAKVRPSGALHLVQAWVPVSELHALAALPDVARVTVPAYAMVRPPISHGFSPAPRATTSPVPTGLAIDASAVSAMQANLLQKVNANGTGVKVGVISSDDYGVSISQQGGYLPNTIFCVSGSNCDTGPSQDGEGTAMMEEVHAMAPNATLGFCGPSTTVDFLKCYTDLIAWGANIIVDDLHFYDIDMFSSGTTNDGSFVTAIAQITLAHPNISFLSASGNDAQDYYEHQYLAAPNSGQTINGITYLSFMDFGAASGSATNMALQITLPQLAPSATTEFQPELEWNDPPGAMPDKFTMFLTNATGTILPRGTGMQAVTVDSPQDGTPLQMLNFPLTSSVQTVYLYIGCQSCANPVTLKLMGEGDGAVLFGTVRPGSIDAGQQVASGVLATVAADASNQSPLSINLEPYSGIGPFLYGRYGATSTLAKPDITGVDSVTVSGAGGFAGGPTPTGVTFCGTSATSPNVGALIADMMSANPGQPASFYYNALETTANQTAFGASPNSVAPCGGPNNLVTGYTAASAGAGLAQGYAALKSFFTFPSTSVTAPIQVADGGTGTYTVPINVAVPFTAAVKAGSNEASASNCVWPGATSNQTGATVSWIFPSAGPYTVSVNCPDSQGILDPTPPTINVTAQNIPPPTAAISGSSQSGFNLTLTGYEPMTMTAISSNSAIVPSSGVTFSSGCGSTTLSCTVALSPAAQANGSTTITVTATDPFGQTGTASTSETYTYTPPPSKGGGGGSMGVLGLMLFGGLLLLRGAGRRE